MYNYKHKTMEELNNLIGRGLECQCGDAYLTFIDTSDLDDVSGLFFYRIINNQVVMALNNVEILKQNLEKWVGVKDTKYTSLKKGII